MATDSINYKFTLGIILLIISLVFTLGPVYFMEEAICLGLFIGLIIMGIGALLILSSGVESIQEWRSGNKDISVKLTALVVFYGIGVMIIQILIPDSLESYFSIGFVIIFLMIFAYLRFTMKKS